MAQHGPHVDNPGRHSHIAYSAKDLKGVSEIHEAYTEASPVTSESHGFGDILESSKRENDGFAAEVYCTESPPTFSQAFELSSPIDRPWRAILLRFGPLSGIACMLVAVLSILVSLGILLGSKNAPTKSLYTDKQMSSWSFETC